MRNNFLEIENVTFAASSKNKVTNVSFNIENEGDIVCLLGPSGIGKTTILRTIAGLEKIQSGKIILKNKIISSKENHVEPEDRNISLAFQDNSLFPHYNVLENINFGAERNKKKKKGLNFKEIVKFFTQTEMYKEFGWAAARLDDIANFLPARLTAFLIILAAIPAAHVRVSKLPPL